MTESNPAAKLAEEIIDVLPTLDKSWRQRHVLKVETRLQPMFDLLQQVHELVVQARQFSSPNSYPYPMLEEIEQLTREYDNET